MKKQFHLNRTKSGSNDFTPGGWGLRAAAGVLGPRYAQFEVITEGSSSSTGAEIIEHVCFQHLSFESKKGGLQADKAVENSHQNSPVNTNRGFNVEI